MSWLKAALSAGPSIANVKDLKRSRSRETCAVANQTTYQSEVRLLRYCMPSMLDPSGDGEMAAGVKA